MLGNRGQNRAESGEEKEGSALWWRKPCMDLILAARCEGVLRRAAEGLGRLVIR